jgi:hypothetical protein
VKRVLKWNVPVDDNPHAIGNGKVVHVAVQGYPDTVQVWTEEAGDVRVTRQVQVFGTGQELRGAHGHIGSCLTGGNALVWHVYEVER